MRVGTNTLRSIITNAARTSAIAALAAITLLGTATPTRAATFPRARMPVGTWIVTQQPDGRLLVITGSDAIDIATDAADGTPGPVVLSLETDRPVRALEIPRSENDPMRAQQWALDKTSFEAAWVVTRGDGVKVAVIDSGVNARHQDLSGSVLPGKDFVTPAGDGRTDPNGHGTHVAGIIAAHVNNSLGIDGAAPGAHILPVRVLDANGNGIASNVAKGIIWSADHGARVINISLGGGTSIGVREAIQYANTKHAVVIAAGGNNGQAGNAPIYPAAYPEAIAVAAVDRNLAHYTLGNTGNYLDLAAPGEHIVSLWGSSPTAYAAATGTSMATPYASAEAALVISAAPKLSALRVKQIMQSTATHLGAPSIFGHGLINPNAAVHAARSAVPRPTTAQLQRQRTLALVNSWLRRLRG